MAQGKGTSTVYFAVPGVFARDYEIPHDLSRLTPRERTDLVKACMLKAFEYHKKHHLPLRFEWMTAKEYGYWITKATAIRKNKAKGRRSDLSPDCNKPNTWTGKTKQGVLTQSSADIHAIGGATKGQVGLRIEYHMEQYVNYNKTTRPSVSKILVSEAERLGRVFVESISEAATRFTSAPVLSRGGKIRGVRSALADEDKWRGTVVVARGSASIG